MWSTLALTTALTLAPAQASPLKLGNARVTYGVLGPERGSAKVLPGDVLFVSFDIENLKVSDEGEVRYSMGMQLTNKDGKVQFKQEPKQLETINSLGTGRHPAFAKAEIGMDTPPGEYTLTVSVTDLAAKATDSLVKRFEVLPMEFGFVRFVMTYDFQGGQAAPYLGVPGQTFWANFALVGFELDTKKKQPNLVAELRIYDENDRPTVAKPLVGTATEVPEQYKKIVPMQFLMNLNRAGRFKLELTAKDAVSGKTAKQTMPLVVVEPGK